MSIGPYRNVGQYLGDLGYTLKPEHEGLAAPDIFPNLRFRQRPTSTGDPAPAVVLDRPRAIPSSYIETKEEIDGFKEAERQISDGVRPGRLPGARQF